MPEELEEPHYSSGLPYPADDLQSHVMSEAYELSLVVSFITVRDDLFLAVSFVTVQYELFLAVAFVTVQYELFLVVSSLLCNKSYFLQRYAAWAVFGRVIYYCAICATSGSVMYVLLGNIGAKITCRFSHCSAAIVLRCNCCYKTAIKWHSVKHTTGFVWPYHFIAILTSHITHMVEPSSRIK